MQGRGMRELIHEALLLGHVHPLRQKGGRVVNAKQRGRVWNEGFTKFGNITFHDMEYCAPWELWVTRRRPGEGTGSQQSRGDGGDRRLGKWVYR